MPEYTGDHRQCDNPECFASQGQMSQDISWQQNCVCCSKNLKDVPKYNPISEAFDDGT